MHNIIEVCKKKQLHEFQKEICFLNRPLYIREDNVSFSSQSIFSSFFLKNYATAHVIKQSGFQGRLKTYFMYMARGDSCILILCSQTSVH